MISYLIVVPLPLFVHVPEHATFQAHKFHGQLLVSRRHIRKSRVIPRYWTTELEIGMITSRG